MSANNPNQSHAKADAKAEHKGKEKGPQRRKSMIDVLIYICGAAVLVGGLCIGYLGVSGGLQNQRVLALEILFATLFFVLAGAFLYFYQNLRRRELVRPDPDNSSRISVDIGNTTDPKSPFQTRFVLTNQNSESIYKVDARGEAWNPVAGLSPFMVADVDFIPELPPNGRFSLNPGNLTVAVLLMPHPPETIVFQLRVKYIHKSAEKSANFGFSAVRKDDGTYVWLPMDPAKDLDQVLREISRRSSQNNVPVIDRGSIAVPSPALQKPIAQGQPMVSVRIVMINTGKSDAFNVAVQYGGIVHNTEPNASDKSFMPSMPNAPIPAKGHAFIDFQVLLRPSEIKLLEQGQNYYMFGRIDYDDVMKVHHTTEFCFVYVPGTVNFKPCSVGNSAT